MTVRGLRQPVSAWRIGDPDGRFPIYSGDGSALTEGRWHRRGQNVIYTAEHYGTAMLEKLVHYNGILPSNQHFIKLEIPAGVSYEVVTKDSLVDWDRPDGTKSGEFGATWFDQNRSCILIVPSFVSREENNILINPNNDDEKQISVDLEKPVRWDNRLFDR